MGNKLFVGGLSWNTDDAGLRSAFERFGEVAEAKVILDRETGRSRGFGFVTFADSGSTDTAIQEMNGASLDGRSIRVNEAQERPRTPRPPGARGPGGPGPGPGGPRGPLPDRAGPGGPRLDAPRSDRPPGRGAPPSGPGRGFAGPPREAFGGGGGGGDDRDRRDRERGGGLRERERERSRGRGKGRGRGGRGGGFDDAEDW